jgi:hypothetical protein
LNTKRYLSYTDHCCDSSYFIPKDKFLILFDQSDFTNRKCQNVRSEYRSDWFVKNDYNENCFILPVVAFINNRTQFINGRHRTAVLLKYMDLIPLTLAYPFSMTKHHLNQITTKPIKKNDFIDLPDLPMYGQV